MKKSGGSMVTDLKSGLVNRSPKAPSETPKGGSVNNETTRDSVAKTPATLGGREA